MRLEVFWRKHIKNGNSSLLMMVVQILQFKKQKNEENQKKCLGELANMVELISNEYQKAYVGGGDGSFFDPYEWEEYCNMSDNDLTQSFYFYDEFGVRCQHDGANWVVFGSGSYGSGSYGYGSYSDGDDADYTSWSDYLAAVAAGTWTGGYVRDGDVATYIGPDDSINKNTGGDNSDIVRQAEKYYGLAYGTQVGKNTLDCSGLVSVALGTYKDGQHWYTNQRDRHGNFVAPKGTSEVNNNNLQVGDVLVWRWTINGNPKGHTVIYAGDGQVIHAGEKGGITYMDLDYWTSRKGTPTVYRRY